MFQNSSFCNYCKILRHSLILNFLNSKLLLISFLTTLNCLCIAPLDSNGNGAIKVNVIIIKIIIVIIIIIIIITGMSSYRNRG